MELLLKRRFKGPKYTIGSLFINGKYFSDTIEDTDRGLKDSMSLSEIQSKKIHGETAIPIGKYKITLDIVSNKYSQKSFYQTNANGGRMPRLLNVKGFDGILIHSGNTELDSLGCILVGENKVKGKVINSQATFKKLYPILQEANKKKEIITIEIV